MATTKVQVEYLKTPTALLQCMANPAIPPDNATDQQLAVFAYQQREATDDCRNRLGYVGRLQAGVK